MMRLTSAHQYRNSVLAILVKRSSCMTMQLPSGCPPPPPEDDDDKMTSSSRRPVETKMVPAVHVLVPGGSVLLAVVVVSSGGGRGVVAAAAAGSDNDDGAGALSLLRGWLVPLRRNVEAIFANLDSWCWCVVPLAGGRIHDLTLPTVCPRPDFSVDREIPDAERRGQEKRTTPPVIVVRRDQATRTTTADRHLPWQL
jgi:hypothetical protein